MIILSHEQVTESPQKKARFEVGEHLQTDSSDSEPDDERCDEVQTSAELRLRRSIVGRVAAAGDAFFRSQQKDEADLTRAEKKRIASELLRASPAAFLRRYGRHLHRDQLVYFERYRDADYETDVHLRRLAAPPPPATAVKNRRYRALKARTFQSSSECSRFQSTFPQSVCLFFSFSPKNRCCSYVLVIFYPRYKRKCHCDILGAAQGQTFDYTALEAISLEVIKQRFIF